MAEQSTQKKFDPAHLAEILATFRDVDGALLPILHAVQEEYGYVPDDAVEPIAKFLRATPAQVYGIVTFYSEFRTKPRGENVLSVCRGPACRLLGSVDLQRQAEERLGIRAGETTTDGQVSLETVACIGICGLAPALALDHDAFGRVDEAQLDAIIDMAQSAPEQKEL